MKLPKLIEPCPILEASVELRFDPKIHPSAVFGMIYNTLQAEFPKVESLPILQLPEPLRLADPNLRYAPHYKIYNDSFVVQIGPTVIAISTIPKYLGWDLFSQKIFEIIEKIESLRIINGIIRIGIRYVNFFDINIFNNINISVCISSKNIDYRNTAIRTEIENGAYKSTLQIANNIPQLSKVGSIIDIDTHINTGLNDFFSKKRDLINDGHIIEKELFFSLLSEDFLTKHNPKY